MAALDLTDHLRRTQETVQQSQDLLEYYMVQKAEMQERIALSRKLSEESMTLLRSLPDLDRRDSA